MREFKALDSKSSKSKYYSTLANLIVYIFRLYLLSKEGKLDLENLDRQPILEDILLERLNTILEHLEAYSSNKDLIELESIAVKLKFSLIEVIAILLAQETSQKTLDSKGIFNSPTITFLILKSIDPNTLYFKKVVEVEKLCSFLIYSFRLWFLAFLEAIEHIPTTIEEIFYNNYKLLLNNRSNNCFEALTQIRAYTRRIDSNLTKESRVTELDLDNLVIDNKKFSITRLSEFFNYLIDSLETILYRDLIEIDPSLLSINPNSIEDDIRNMIPGFYFIDFITKTQDFSIYKDFLIKRLLDRSSSFSIKYLKSINTTTTRSNSSSLKFDSKSIKSFLDNRTKFLELLSIAIYLTSGSPLRGEEVVVIKYLNTLESGPRNIVIEPKNGWIRINTTYHKSYNITRLDSNNIRFLSPRLSNILKLYLLIVIPFYKFIAIEYLDLKEISGFLLEENNTRFTSSRLSNILSKESNSFLLNSLTLNPYRHLITYIIKNRLDLDYNSSSNSENENLIEDIQANHSTKTSNLIYGRESKLFRNSSISLEKRSLEFNIKFFTFFGLLDSNSSRTKHARQKSSISTSKPLTKKTRLTKTRSNSSSTNNSIDLDIDSNLNTLEENSKIRSLLDYSNVNLNTIRSSSGSSIENSLKLLFNNPEARFKSIEQNEAIEAIIGNKDPFITYINGTGSGKSLLFFLPYYINPNSIYIVVTPRISLKEDLYNRATSFNLPSEIYNSTKWPSSNLLFLSLENLLDPNLDKFLHYLISKGVSITIYLDEAHTLLLEVDFRPILNYISSIVKYKVKLVFLSATLPIELLNLLEVKFNIKSNRVIKGSTTRNNIRYIVKKLEKNSQELKELGNYIEAEVKPNIALENKKAIIFTTSKAYADTISKYLHIPAYYSGKDKGEDILARFLASNTTTPIIVATSAVGLGLDDPNIKYSIHVGKQYSLISIEQEIGRIGRDSNLISISIIFYRPYNYKVKEIEDLEEYNSNNKGKAPINDLQEEIYNRRLARFKNLDYNRLIAYLEEKCCYRRVLEGYFNNNYLESCLSTLEKCSLCLEKESNLDYSFNRQNILEADNLNTLHLLDNKLNSINNSCLECILDFNFNSYFIHSTNKYFNTTNPILLDLSTRLEKTIKSNKIIKEGYSCF